MNKIRCTRLVLEIWFFTVYFSGKRRSLLHPNTAAVRHANKENTPEVVNATHQLQSMVGRNAKGNPAKLKPAMKRFHAQVSLINILPFSATLG